MFALFSKGAGCLRRTSHQGCPEKDIRLPFSLPGFRPAEKRRSGCAIGGRVVASVGNPGEKGPRPWHTRTAELPHPNIFRHRGRSRPRLRLSVGPDRGGSRRGTATLVLGGQPG